MSVDLQRTADATGIPRLSAAAETAIGAVAAATDEKARATAWRGAQADKRVTCELWAFGLHSWRHPPRHRSGSVSWA